MGEICVSLQVPLELDNILNYRNGTTVVLNVWILGYFGNNFCPGHKVSGNLVEEGGCFRLNRLDLGESVFLDRNAKVVSVLDLGNHEGNPHLQQVGIFDQGTDDRFDHLNELADGRVALDTTVRQGHHLSSAGQVQAGTLCTGLVAVGFLRVCVTNLDWVGYWNVEVLQWNK